VEPWFLDWWRQQGGLVHQRHLSFYDQLQALVDAGLKHVSWLASYGAFLRLDIPFILQVQMLRYSHEKYLSICSCHACGPHPKAPLEVAATAAPCLLPLQELTGQHSADVEQDTVLYTDADVMFLKAGPKPIVFCSWIASITSALKSQTQPR
jgi:hypothetical protein